MNDGVDGFIAQKPADKLLIAAFADDERHVRGDRPVVAGGQIVEHDHALAGLEKLEHHMAADIAGAAGDQDCHGFGLVWLIDSYKPL
jgi:hypothetical protein